jgi:hypothetical protein
MSRYTMVAREERPREKATGTPKISKAKSVPNNIYSSNV